MQARPDRLRGTGNAAREVMNTTITPDGEPSRKEEPEAPLADRDERIRSRPRDEALAEERSRHPGAGLGTSEPSEPAEPTEPPSEKTSEQPQAEQGSDRRRTRRRASDGARSEPCGEDESLDIAAAQRPPADS